MVQQSVASYAASTLHDFIHKDESTILIDMYRRTKLLAMLPRERLAGSNIEYRIGASEGGGFGYNFTDAQAEADEGAVVGEVKINTNTESADYFFVSRLDHKALVLSEAANGAGSYMKGRMLETQRGLQSLMVQLNKDLYRSGTGKIGVRSSISTNTITLTDANDVRNFRPGMRIEAAATETGAKRTGSAKITNVSKRNGTVTVDSAAGITSFADNDFLFLLGGSQNGGSERQPVGGFQLWITDTPSTIYTLDQTVNDVAYAGTVVDGSGTTPISAIVEGISEIRDLGGEPTAGLCGKAVFNAIKDSLSHKEVIDVSTQVPNVSFKGILVEGVPLMMDYHAPQDEVLLGEFNSSTVKLLTADPVFPAVYRQGMTDMLTVNDANAVEWRMPNYLQLALYRPDRFCRVNNLNT